MSGQEAGFEELIEYFQVRYRNNTVVLDSPVYRTSRGTRYLRGPGLVLLSKPHVDLSAINVYLEGYQPEFTEYLNDSWDSLTSGEVLIKFAGQTCYCSFGHKRTYNKDIERYLDNLKASGHGSVFEHANYTFLVYGVSRSLTHEFIRHRAGFAYSQQSTRYIDQAALRFIERPEFQNDEMLHNNFLNRI
ncbi:MAG: FAD-dependent thymidylate synthase, partial [Deltaproteobacteria bacterium]|nr:FAD-dependent thymidylate synthase [Deltaproteobacteria bacterium]